MRLIDADVVKQNIFEVIKKQGGKSKDLIPVMELPLFIDIQPTAYSVDKVVEGLEERKTLHERLVDYETKNGTVTEKYQHIKAIDVLNYAIEIVKQGDVSDDLCECRLFKDHKFLHKTSCGNVFDMQKGFKYCPYCGKKIKVEG